MFSLLSLIGLNARAQNDSTKNKKQDTIKIGNMVIVGDHSTIVEGGSEWTRNNRRRKNNGVTVYNFKDTLVSINDDTIKVGRINIINKSEGSEGYGQKNWESLLEGDFKKTKISIEKSPKKLKKISTNWWILDIGYANYLDNSPQMAYIAIYDPLMPRIVNSTDLKLNNAKSSNVNIWVVQQKASLYKNYLNLKYGVGFEMYNFRFQQPISFSNAAFNKVYFDDVNYLLNT
jgi:hypothetical protein